MLGRCWRGGGRGGQFASFLHCVSVLPLYISVELVLMCDTADGQAWHLMHILCASCAECTWVRGFGVLGTPPGGRGGAVVRFQVRCRGVVFSRAFQLHVVAPGRDESFWKCHKYVTCPVSGFRSVTLS